MRKGVVILALPFVLFAMVVSAPAATVVRYFGEAEILIPQADEERLQLYKGICDEAAVPEFVSELKKKDPMITKDNLYIGVSYDKKKGAVTIGLIVDDEKTAVEYARKLAEVAVSKFVAYDNAERRRAIDPVEKQKAELEYEVEALGKKLVELRKEADVYTSTKEIEFLVISLNSYKEQLVQAEMKQAELATKLALLSKKAVAVKDTVSIEKIGLLEKTAQELAMQLDDTAKARYENELRKCEILLKQKEGEFQRVKELQEKGLTSFESLKKVQAEYELAVSEYEMVRGEMEQLKKRLDKVTKDLAEARSRLAETGGLGLATIIAEKTLESETEMAGVKTKMARLRDKVQEVENEIAEKRVEVSEVEKRQVEIDAANTRVSRLQKELEGLGEEKRRLEREVPVRQPEIVKVEWSPRYWMMEPKLGIYEIAGEVKRPFGEKELERGTTLMKAIEAAGGFTEGADMEHVTVIRESNGSPEKHVIDCKAIAEGKSPDNFVIYPKDVVWVPTKPGAERVEPVEPKEFVTVEVKGEVKEPGAKKLPVPPTATLLIAIEAAGGFADEADAHRVSVFRRTDGSMVENILNCELLKGKRSSDDFRLRSGDWVSVPRTGTPEAKAVKTTEEGATYYVIGEVTNPGPRELGPKTTVLKAIAEAGGFTDAAKKEAIVIRTDGDHTKRYVIDCTAIMTGEAPDDLMIESGDVISVPVKHF